MIDTAGGKQLRILQVTPYYHPHIGGVERHVRAISERLVVFGNEITVATVSDQEKEMRRCVGGVHVYGFPSIGFGSSYRLPIGLVRFLRKNCAAFDIVHVHNYHASLLPIVAAVRPRCMVVTAHLNDLPHSVIARLLHTPYKLVGRRSLDRAQAIICVSENERDRLVSRLRIPPDRMVVIPNGEDGLQLDTPGDRESRDPFLALIVSRLEAYKRIDCAIAAMAMLPAAHRLTIIGQGSRDRALRQQAERLGIADRVTFIDRVTDQELGGWYRRAQVLLHLSEAEAFGLVVAEAMSKGCQAVCSDIPAFREMATRYPGRVTIVDRGDEPSIAGALVRASQCSDVSNGPIDNALYSWDTATQHLLSIYRQIQIPAKPGESR